MKKFESTFWLLVKTILYISMLLIFIRVFGMSNIGLSRLSRTYGITISTFTVVGVLFMTIYGRYDVGRRKSKPIIHSLVLAVVCTDVITYVQTMIMRINTTNVQDFRLVDLELLVITIGIQVVVIIVAVYAGNGIFFTIHKPEKCYLVTSSQESLDAITRAMSKFQKQYEIAKVIDYRDPNMSTHIKESETIFMYDIPADYRVSIMRQCYENKKNVYFNPEIEDIMEFNATRYMLDDVFLYNKNMKAITMEQRIMKRVMDITFSVVGGIVSSPLWIIGMIAIKIEDRGPVFFKQNRATINGTIFQVYKLRTMSVGAEIRSASKDDVRVTSVGKVLRRTRVDEIPQLWNVLKGDMSIVGPRPEMLVNVFQYTEQLPEFQYRLRMKAGLTGYAQIAGKYNTTPKDKLVMDMMYIEQFNIWKDIQLIFQTLIIFLKFDSTEGFEMPEAKNKYKFEPWSE